MKVTTADEIIGTVIFPWPTNEPKIGWMGEPISIDMERVPELITTGWFQVTVELGPRSEERAAPFPETGSSIRGTGGSVP